LHNRKFKAMSIKPLTQPTRQPSPQPEPLAHLDLRTQSLKSEPANAGPLPQELSDNQAGLHGTSAAIESDHLADIEKTFDAPAAVPVGDGGSADEFVTPERFRKSFFKMFNTAGRYSFESLKIRPEETEDANEAANELYEICCEIHWLNWAVTKNTSWLARIATVAAFVGPKVIGCKIEIDMRRQAALKPAQQAAPKKDETPATWVREPEPG